MIGFILLFILNIYTTSNGTAIKYGAGVNKNEELLWTCNVCDKDEMKDIFGNDWDNSGLFENLSRGKKMKWQIKDIDENDLTIDIEIDEWLWNDHDNWGIYDNNFQISYFSNPKYYIEDINFSNYAFLVPFLFPIPVSEYLGELNFSKWYDVDNRVLTTLNIEITKDSIMQNYPIKDITIIAIYNERGILTSYKLYLTGNIVILDISYDYLPFYVIPTLFGLTAIITIAIIVYIIKRRRLKLIS